MTQGRNRMQDFYELTPAQQAERFRTLGAEALKHWGIENARLSLIKMRENAVFSVDTPGGVRFALRIHRHNYHSDAALWSELQWMKALEENGIDVPKVVPSSAGNLFEIVKSDAVPEPRQVDLFEWIEGTPLGSAGEGVAGDAGTLRANFRTIGELAARVHNQASAWRLPEGFRRHAWNAEGLAGESPLWGRFWELDALTDPQRDLIRRARRRVHDELVACGQSPGTYGIIHADLTPENIMVHNGRVRLIDFDDAGFGWHLFEITTALYFHRREDYFENARDALIEGYRAHRQLTDETLEHLPLFFVARSFTYLGWIHTRKGTQAAMELGPMLVEAACSQAEEFLSNA